MKNILVSVIVPVYNVEPYINQCIESILNQTYKNLEIILIDDGSTDGSGIICDSYTDARITVYHTDNRGLSAARNLGIDNSHGEYLYFLDSDDWIAPNLLEQAVANIGTGDILCFCKYAGTYTGLEALCALITGKIDAHIWNKFFLKKCFSSIRFPEGRIVEDVATTYKLLHKSKIVVCGAIHGHHYRKRKGSITSTHNLKNIFDFCLAVNEQYNYCAVVFSASRDSISEKQMEEIKTCLLKTRAVAIARAWAWREGNQCSESSEWERLSFEARTMFPYSISKQFPWRIRGGLFLARFNSHWSFWLAHKAHIMTKIIITKRKF